MKKLFGAWNAPYLAKDGLASLVNGGHLKYRSPNGYECDYDSEGNLLPDQNANYTYNYGSNLLKHIYQDFLPHFIYGGNSAYTPGLTSSY